MTILLSRRLILGGTAGLAVAIAARPARATADSMRAAMRAFAAGAEIRTGRVTLEIPPLVENGSTVPLTVAVESPMTEQSHVFFTWTLSGRDLVVTEALLRVAGFLGAFIGMYFTVVLATDETYRSEFMEDTSPLAHQALAVRLAYKHSHEA